MTTESTEQKPERKKQRRHLPKVDKDFIRDLGSQTGFRKEEVRLAYAACMKIIRDQLSAGKEVNIPHVGKFVFIMAKPRKIPKRTAPNGRVLEALNLEDRLMLKFKVLDPFKKRVRNEVKPKIVRRHQRWSDVRKAAKMASQILSGEQTVSPSNQPDMEPSASQGQGHSSHTQEKSPDVAGTNGSPDCKSGSNGIGTTAPAEPREEPSRQIESEPAECETKLQASATASELQSEAP